MYDIIQPLRTFLMFWLRSESSWNQLTQKTWGVSTRMMQWGCVHILRLFVKVFSAKFGGVASFGMAKASNLRKFSLWKSYFSPIRESLLPLKLGPCSNVKKVRSYFHTRKPLSFSLVQRILQGITTCFGVGKLPIRHLTTHPVAMAMISVLLG